MASLQIFFTAAQLIVVLVLVALSSTSLRAQDSNVALSNPHKTTCVQFFHIEVLKVDGCTVEVPLLSCEGSCHSDATPTIFYER